MSNFPRKPSEDVDKLFDDIKCQVLDFYKDKEEDTKWIERDFKHLSDVIDEWVNYGDEVEDYYANDICKDYDDALREREDIITAKEREIEDLEDEIETLKRMCVIKDVIEGEI